MKRGRILVVDDNAINRKLVATLLAHEGYEVSEAADGSEGLAIARAILPQLVISDILMPSMDGYEFVRRLRADAVTAVLRVIFYTANYHETEARSLASQCGVSRVIVKPCPAPQLLQIVASEIVGEAVHAAPVPESSFDVEHLRLLTDKLSQSADTLRAANSRLAALTDLNLQMASEKNPRALLDSVCRQARSLAGARFSVLCVADKQKLGGVTTCVSGLPPQLAPQLPAPADQPGLLGQVHAQRHTRRAAAPEGELLDLGFPPEFPPVRSALAVPVCSLTRNWGWLCLADKLGADGFSSDDEKLLTILGAQLGRIYENGSLYREVQEQATELMVEIEERRVALEQLRASEERFRELAENIHDVFFVTGPDLSHTTYVSPGYERIWGRPAADVLHREGAWFETVHPDDRARMHKEVRQVLGSQSTQGESEFRIIRPDGSVRWVLTRVFPVHDAQGTVIRTVGVTKDITERKLAELRIMRLNRTHSVLSGINSLIVRATDRSALLHAACRLAVDQGGFRVAWCGLVEPQSRELRTSACAGESGDLAGSVRVRVDEANARASVVVEAMLAAAPRFCNDLLQDGVNILFRDEYEKKGYRSLAALPLVVSGESIGCFVLYADTADYFDADEQRLLIELAEDIAFALDHIGKAEQLHFLASFDPLTGMANRSAFQERVSNHARVAARTGTRFAVVIADPERFEALNSTLGRAVGDEILRQAASRFVGAAGGPDMTGHLGSDQFAAIIPDAADETSATRQLEALWRKWLGTPLEIDGRSIELTARGGVALYPDDGETADALLVNASAALRDAKESGKTHAFYARHLSERFAERLGLEKDLRRALDNGEYELYYQPKVDVARRTIEGVEALIRWRRPGHGVVMPAAFIPLLETSGMIVEVGAWALRQACQQHRQWQQSGLRAPRIAVNVSAVQLRRDDFVATVRGAIAMADGPSPVDLEVTESLLMDQVEENLAKLTAVRALGVGLALDDFGTGYSSLAYLARLPVGTLKIDRAFVASMLDDSSVMTLVSTILTLARALKLDTVAEGVESEEQAKILRLLGCDQIQGYLISQPVPADAMTALLARSAH